MYLYHVCCIFGILSERKAISILLWNLGLIDALHIAHIYERQHSIYGHFGVSRVKYRVAYRVGISIVSLIHQQNLHSVFWYIVVKISAFIHALHPSSILFDCIAHCCFYASSQTISKNHPLPHQHILVSENKKYLFIGENGNCAYNSSI